MAFMATSWKQTASVKVHRDKRTKDHELAARDWKQLMLCPVTGHPCEGGISLTSLPGIRLRSEGWLIATIRGKFLTRQSQPCAAQRLARKTPSACTCFPRAEHFEELP